MKSHSGISRLQFSIFLILCGLFIYIYWSGLFVLANSNKINQKLVDEIHELRLELTNKNKKSSPFNTEEFIIQNVYDPFYQNDVLSKLDSIKNEITKLLKVSLKHHLGERAGEEQYERFYR